MGTYANRSGPHHPEETYVPHLFEEQLVDLGELQMNYVVAGTPEHPALLLVPGQTESWWGHEDPPLFASQVTPART